MCFLVLSKTVHVLEPSRTGVTLHVLFIRMHVQMRLQVGLCGEACEHQQMITVNLMTSTANLPLPHVSQV